MHTTNNSIMMVRKTIAYIDNLLVNYRFKSIGKEQQSCLGGASLPFSPTMATALICVMYKERLTLLFMFILHADLTESLIEYNLLCFIIQHCYFNGSSPRFAIYRRISYSVLEENSWFQIRTQVLSWVRTQLLSLSRIYHLFEVFTSVL